MLNWLISDIGRMALMWDNIFLQIFQDFPQILMPKSFASLCRSQLAVTEFKAISNNTDLRYTTAQRKLIKLIKQRNPIPKLCI